MSLQEIYNAIYNALRSGGLTRWGALACMGNFQAESGNEPVRVEGDFAADRSMSKTYMADVDSGKITKQSFCFDGRGWGIYQLTFWSRKEGFFDLCKKKGVSIGNAETQIEWFFSELKSGYPDLYNYLKKCQEADLFNATSRICKEFERPAVNNVTYRYNAALEIGESVKDEEQAKETYWPPRKLEKGMKGPDVEVLQAVLKARGYSLNYISGTFDEVCEQAVNEFKASAGLGVPGVVGTKTWSKLLKR